MKNALLIYVILLSFSSPAQNLYSYINNGKIGYIDSVGDVRISPVYDHGDQFSEGLAAVYFGKKVGYINEQGDLVIPAVFERGLRFNDGVAVVVADSCYGLIDKQGKYILKPVYQYIQFQAEGKIGVKKNDLWGFYTIDGKRVSKIKYQWIGEFSEGLADVRERGKYAFIDSKGNVKIPLNLTEVYSPYQNGYACVGDSLRNIGFIDIRGINIFNKHFYNASGFHEGMAFVRDELNSPGYFINTKGEKLNDIMYKKAWWFSDGFSGAETDSNFVVLDTLGNEVYLSKIIELRFYVGDFGFFCDHTYSSLTWGLMNRNQEIISDLRFTLLETLPSGKFIEFYIGDRDKWYGYGKRGYIDIHGKVLWMED